MTLTNTWKPFRASRTDGIWIISVADFSTCPRFRINAIFKSSKVLFKVQVSMFKSRPWQIRPTSARRRTRATSDRGVISFKHELSQKETWQLFFFLFFLFLEATRIPENLQNKILVHFFMRWGRRKKIADRRCSNTTDELLTSRKDNTDTQEINTEKQNHVERPAKWLH